MTTKGGLLATPSYTLEDLYKTHHKFLLDVANRVLQNHADADDAVAMCYLQITQMEAKGNLVGLAVTITKRSCYRILRDRSRRGGTHLPLDGTHEEQRIDPLDDRPDPLEILEAIDALQRVRWVAESILTDIRLMIFEELVRDPEIPRRDLAARVGINEGTLGFHINKMRTQLREHF